jgi:hypothetical protein
VDTTLYVITAVFNPWRYKSRIKLYNDFAAYIALSPNVKLVTVELAFGDRPYEVTEPNNPLHVQLRTNEEIWHKERMVNLAINRLPHDWKYVAWIDADITFAKLDWALETVHLLQHYQVLQMFSHAVDVGPNHEHLRTHTGFMFANAEGLVPEDRPGMIWNYDHVTMQGTPRMEALHPGFAWAARREAVHNLGGLIDYAALGSADRHMAYAFVEKVELSYPKGISMGYYEALQIWQKRCKEHIRKNIGYMPGMITHYWHGKKVDRRYQDRWQILIEHQYDPEFDIKPDTYGLYQHSGNKPQLEYDIRNYFKARNEDSIDVD